MRTNIKPPTNAVYRYGDKQAEFINYLKGKYSEYTIYRTIGYIQSKLVTEELQNIVDTSLIYDITNIALLKKLLINIRNTEQDKRLHKVYSSAVNRYINYIKTPPTGWIR